MSLYPEVSFLVLPCHHRVHPRCSMAFQAAKLEGRACRITVLGTNTRSQKRVCGFTSKDNFKGRHFQKLCTYILVDLPLVDEHFGFTKNRKTSVIVICKVSEMLKPYF